MTRPTDMFEHASAAPGGPAVASSPAGFSAEWLRLREQHDRVARDAAFGGLGLGAWTTERRRVSAEPLHVVDLGCGTGANLRYLAPRLGGEQRWRLFDHDAALLDTCLAESARWAADQGIVIDRVDTSTLQLLSPGSLVGATQTRRTDSRTHAQPFAVEAEVHCLDLAAMLPAFDGAGQLIVTASALLDLVSAEWLARLVAACHAAQARLLWALSFNGRIEWSIAHELDEVVATLFCAHQRRDKGFGLALGPTAAAHAAKVMREAGYAVREGRSDWVIGPGDPLQLALIEGIASAAAEQAQSAADIAPWRARRLGLSARATLRIGHVDLFATPKGTFNR